MKFRSTFFTEENINKIRNNSMGTKIREYIMEDVEKWKNMSYDELWEMIYGVEIKRARFVFTDGEFFPDGYCPACGQAVHLDGWVYDVFKEPWKVWCPHCKEKFPKNDFEKYYRSGMDEHYEFSYELADRSLLYNTDAPDPEDPKHMFGVDDGKGYFQGKEGWLFIGNHIMNHIWYLKICEGISMLTRAYLLTGDKDYAIKCGIILDRIADIFPKFNFYEQAYNFTYKTKTERGYVTGWCEIIRQLYSMLFGYDAIFDVIKEDETFQSFVIAKSEKYKTAYRKSCFKDIQTNIEDRIFGNALANQWKTESNPPWPDMYIALEQMVLTEFPNKPDDIPYDVYFIMWFLPEKILKRVIVDSTKIDGMSGEKSFGGYGMIAVQNMAKLITWISLYDKKILEKMVKLYPEIVDGIHFVINAWLLCSYYPGCGDTGSYVKSRSAPVSPGYLIWDRNVKDEFRNGTDKTILFSYEGFLWKLYKITGDLNVLRFMYNADNYDIDKLFTTDLTFDDSPIEIQNQFKKLMEEHGSELEQHSMNAKMWKLALLHSGKGEYKRAAYLDYDSGGVHGHNDGMNIGIYTKDMNFLPDIGYPPVVSRAGGFHSEFAYWYRSAASHNTAIVDGVEHRDYTWYQRDVMGGQGLYSESGRTVLWGIGDWVKAVSADNPDIAASKRFERTLAMVDLSDEECYFFDIFRIKGGHEHVKLTNGGLDCSMQTNGLGFESYEPAEDPFGAGFIRDRNPVENIPYSFDTGFKFIRDMHISKDVKCDWNVTWDYKYTFNKMLMMAEGKEYSLMYSDLTDDKDVIAYKSFFDALGMTKYCYPESLEGKNDQPEIMRPGIAILRKSYDEEELETVFIGIYDTSDNGMYNILSSKRIMVDGETDHNKGPVAFEIETRFGTDLILAGDVQDKREIRQKDWDVRTDADLCIFRKTNDGLYKLTLFNGSYFECKGKKIELSDITEVYEEEFCIK